MELQNGGVELLFRLLRYGYHAKHVEKKTNIDLDLLYFFLNSEDVDTYVFAELLPLSNSAIYKCKWLRDNCETVDIIR